MEGARNERQIHQQQMRSTILFARGHWSGVSILPPCRD